MQLSRVVFKENILVNFSGNEAENGGAISVNMRSCLKFADNAELYLLNNSATESGGAVHLSDQFTVNISQNSKIEFCHNTANQYGGALYCDLTKNIKNKFTFNTTEVVFKNNPDLTGSDIYVNIPKSCDEMCLYKSIVPNGFSGNFSIKTSPRKLVFYNSAVAVTCTDKSNDTNCKTYLAKNIMLGQEIIIRACVLDYYNQKAESTQFVLSSTGQLPLLLMMAVCLI